MKKKWIAKIATPVNTQEQCKLYNNLQEFAQSLYYLKDASEIKKDKLRPAPDHLLDVLF